MDITQRLIGSETDHMELENFLAGLGSSQRELRDVTKSSTTYYGGNIRATTDGKGKLTSLEWLGEEGEPLERFLREAYDALAENHGVKIGHSIAFFKYPIETTYRAEGCCQIIPPPASWPRPAWTNAPHPAIIEFAYPRSPNQFVDQFRRDRAYHYLSSFFSVALKSSIIENRANTPTWVVDPNGADDKVTCLKTGYFGGDNHWLEKDEHGFSITHAIACPCIPAEIYYQRNPLFDHEFQVPEGLTANLGRFRSLPPEKMDQFMRAAHWYRASIAALSISSSMALCGLFSAIEALVGPLPQMSSSERCRCCGRGQQPSAGRRFRDFLNIHAGLNELDNAREIVERYSSERNGFVHGSKLSTFDIAPYDGGFSELRDRDRKIYYSVRHVFQIATINWLPARDPAG